MAFCKVCACGEKIIFEKRLGFPDSCPSCGRKLVDFITYSEDDLQVEELIQGYKNGNEEENDEKILVNEIGSGVCKYILRLINGDEIDIPDDGCIIGRTEVGAEKLRDYPSVSRQHLRVTPRKNIGIIVEDISHYGTFVDGQRLIRNSPICVSVGSRIRLCNVEMIVMQKGE